jgi:threonine aldolase
MQLASKMRFIAAQFTTMLSDDLWLRNARQANAMASLLGRLVAKVPGARLARGVEANGVFAILSREVIDELLEDYFFYVWDESTNEVRWITSFDTTEEDVRALVQSVSQAAERSRLPEGVFDGND